jgi:hypothetical protein
MIRHVVLLRFDPQTSAETINEVFAGFGALAARLSGITAVSYGKNVSPEGLDRGYLHGFVMDFKSPSARDAYLAHPEHVAFAEGTVIPALAAGLDSIAVFDYEIAE